MKFRFLAGLLLLTFFQVDAFAIEKNEDGNNKASKKITNITITNTSKKINQNTKKNNLKKITQEESLKSIVNEIVANYLNQPGNVGLVIGLLNDTSTAYLSYGLTEIGGYQKPDKNTLFEIGSLTKPFTALLALELARKNKLNLNDSITKHLPDSLTNEHLKKISLNNLLLHTAQLPRKPFNLSLTGGNNNNPYKNYTNQHLLEYLNVFKPVKRKKKQSFKYSNLGYGALGLSLQQAGSASYKRLLNQYVIETLNLKNTFLQIPGNKKVNLAQPYSFNGLPTENYTYSSAMEASSGLYSCAEDLITLIKKQIQSGPANSIASSLQKCLEPQQKTNLKRTYVTYAWTYVDRGKRLPPVYIYNGGTAGYRAYVAFVKENNTGVVVLSNSANRVDEIAITLIQLLNQ